MQILKKGDLKKLAKASLDEMDKATKPNTYRAEGADDRDRRYYLAGRIHRKDPCRCGGQCWEASK